MTGWKSTVSALPASPGVYLFKDARGRVLYVGKARSLKDRVRSYFAPDAHPDAKTRRMLDRSADLETIGTASETDALLLESRLIKDLKPKYNILLKDGKSLPWFRISESDDFPLVEVTREAHERGSRYYGPFMDPGGLHRSLQVLQGAFRFRTCTLELHADDTKRRYRPCLLHAIRRCSAPCAGYVSKEAYAEQIEGLKRVLSGDKVALIDEVKERMRSAAERMDFERAAVLRDRVRALESLDKRGRFSDRPDDLVGPLTPAGGLEELRRLLRLPYPIRRMEGIDIAVLQGEDAVGSLVAFQDGIPFKDRYRRYRIRTVEGMDDFAMIREVVSRRFRRAAEGDDWIPQVLLIDGGLGQWNAASSALEASGGGSGVCLISLAKKEERLFTPERAAGIVLPRRSEALRICQFVRDEAHRFAGGYHHLLRRKRLLGGYVPGRGKR